MQDSHWVWIGNIVLTIGVLWIMYDVFCHPIANRHLYGRPKALRYTFWNFLFLSVLGVIWLDYAIVCYNGFWMVAIVLFYLWLRPKKKKVSHE